MNEDKHQPTPSNPKPPNQPTHQLYYILILITLPLLIYFTVSNFFPQLLSRVASTQLPTPAISNNNSPTPTTQESCPDEPDSTLTTSQSCTESESNSDTDANSKSETDKIKRLKSKSVIINNDTQLEYVPLYDQSKLNNKLNNLSTEEFIKLIDDSIYSKELYYNNPLNIFSGKPVNCQALSLLLYDYIEANYDTDKLYKYISSTIVTEDVPTPHAYNLFVNLSTNLQIIIDLSQVGLAKGQIIEPNPAPNPDYSADTPTLSPNPSPTTNQSPTLQDLEVLFNDIKPFRLKYK